MPSDNHNLDDFFRQQLGQHATPPGADLQRRLAELAEAERLDNLFRAGLGSHASQPSRAVWERLEDEHLHPRPRRRRAVAWWQLSAAAVLLLLAGGGLLWRGQLRQPAGPMATATPQSKAVEQPTPAQLTAPSRQAVASTKTEAQDTDNKSIASSTEADSEKKQVNIFRQATAPTLSPSSHPIATATRPRRPATAPHAASSFHMKTRRPDAAAGALATAGERNTPAGRATLPTPPVAPETPALAAATVPPAPAGIIEVDVRRGPDPARPAAVVAASPSPAADQPRRRLRLGGLLRQADHLVHGEPVSLAEATGLPESLTVQARLGGRSISRTIQL
jgi:hypothetical protein